ncbi:peptidase C39 family protein [Terrabacter ginsenosidimutans]|uniref:Peptidase C39 family protein n=1 Tax=Terrabacter ginsenosidimutans TaxID=490575 RepID=A0ABP7ELU5_9MICO
MSRPPAPEACSPSRRRVLGSAAGATLVAAAGVGSASAAPSAASSAAPSALESASDTGDRHVSYREWSGRDVVVGRFSGRRDHVDPFDDTATSRSYDVATWVSPVVRPGFGLTELVASWNADTPGRSWVEVAVRGRTDGVATMEYVLGRWCRYDPTQGGGIHRTSVKGQGDSVATVYTDTLATRSGHVLDEWQLVVRLMRPTGTRETPRLRSVGAMASALPDTERVPRSPQGRARGQVLDVPTFSQETHIGHFPQWDNGGEAWCSPTSTSMVLAYWGVGPRRDETAWVTEAMPSEADPQVDFAARNVYDYTYDGGGNWPFNTAYAATRPRMRAFVTRLRSLTEAEEFIAAGIPLITSVSFEKGELDGAGYGTNGHLMVVVGFTRDGDVVCNDPASHLVRDNGEVRVVYDREQFENVWVPHSGGIVYVIHPERHRLPRAPRREPNW